MIGISVLVIIIIIIVIIVVTTASDRSSRSSAAPVRPAAGWSVGDPCGGGDEGDDECASGLVCAGSDIGRKGVCTIKAAVTTFSSLAGGPCGWKDIPGGARATFTCADGLACTSNKPWPAAGICTIPGGKTKSQAGEECGWDGEGNGDDDCDQGGSEIGIREFGQPPQLVCSGGDPYSTPPKPGICTIPDIDEIPFWNTEKDEPDCNSHYGLEYPEPSAVEDGRQGCVGASTKFGGFDDVACGLDQGTRWGLSNSAKWFKTCCVAAGAHGIAACVPKADTVADVPCRCKELSNGTSLSKARAGLCGTEITEGETCLGPAANGDRTNWKGVCVGGQGCVTAANGTSTCRETCNKTVIPGQPPEDHVYLAPSAA